MAWPTVLHLCRSERFDLALGRLQTKFVARGGVFAKSLDRNDSHNARVNWTDGAHGTLRARNGWVGHLILQHNSACGPSNIRRGFEDDDSRVTGFVALENVTPKGVLVQRGIDISYLPKSLLKDGDQSGRIEDYWGLVARAAVRWPQRAEGRRLRFSAELGYAPETPTESAVDLGSGDGDVDGVAVTLTASVMDYLPNHSLGLNFGRLDAGWLLSPQYRENEALDEIRYQWRRSRQLAFDLRARWRKELDQLTTAARTREDFDIFLRLTWGFTSRRLLGA